MCLLVIPQGLRLVYAPLFKAMFTSCFDFTFYLLYVILNDMVGVTALGRNVLHLRLFEMQLSLRTSRGTLSNRSFF